MIRVDYPGPIEEISRRQILGRPCPEFFREALETVAARGFGREGNAWTLTLGPSLLFDESGLRVLIEGLRAYRGDGSHILFRIKLDAAAYRDYYSLGRDPDAALSIALPVEAKRTSGGSGRDTITVDVRYSSTIPPYPRSLAQPAPVMTPLALLMEYHGDVDLLFANQIALFSRLAREVPWSLRTWLRALIMRRSGGWKRRLGLAYARIHPTADVHPTAVIEGSVIEADARIAAHSVVRYSHIGRRAVLHDGAKVEFSVVGPGSWLMHDLVCFRCLLEDEVFLIHGPYQFSSFQSGSAAFATIMMDYRPDGLPLRVATRSGLREYGGRFLGALLQEGAKALGGSLLAPGITLPADTWLACDPDTVHRPVLGVLPQNVAVPPRRKAPSEVAAEPSLGA